MESDPLTVGLILLILGKLFRNSDKINRIREEVDFLQNEFQRHERAESNKCDSCEYKRRASLKENTSNRSSGWWASFGKLFK